MTKTRLVIIGNGMVGHRFIEALVEKAEMARYDITVFCAEPRLAYDRVHLSSFFSHHNENELSLVANGFYEQHGIKVLIGERALRIDTVQKHVSSARISSYPYDKLVLATGSVPHIPPIPGSQSLYCFAYRTLGDLNAIESWARRCRRGAVIGGGLLGLEAAGALKALGVETHVVESAPTLMAGQLDESGSRLLHQKIEAMGVYVHTGKTTLGITPNGTSAKNRLSFSDGENLDVDFVVFSAGIRPQDKLARESGLAVGANGGFMIDDFCRTSDPDIYAIGECASWQDQCFGLVAPGYRMAQVAADHLLGQPASFEGADMSARLKLLGVEVGSIGDAQGRTVGSRSYAYLDEINGIYRRLVVSANGNRLLGAQLVGDTRNYALLQQLVLNEAALPPRPEILILPNLEDDEYMPASGVDALPDSAPICSCYGITKGRLLEAIREGHATLAALKAETRAGAVCGGCLTLMTQIIDSEGKTSDPDLETQAESLPLTP